MPGDKSLKLYKNLLKIPPFDKIREGSQPFPKTNGGNPKMDVKA